MLKALKAIAGNNHMSNGYGCILQKLAKGTQLLHIWTCAKEKMIQTFNQ